VVERDRDTVGRAMTATTATRLLDNYFSSGQGSGAYFVGR
jgi:hypothetical protein